MAIGRPVTHPGFSQGEGRSKNFIYLQWPIKREISANVSPLPCRRLARFFHITQHFEHMLQNMQMTRFNDRNLKIWCSVGPPSPRRDVNLSLGTKLSRVSSLEPSLELVRCPELSQTEHGSIPSPEYMTGETGVDRERASPPDPIHSISWVGPGGPNI